MPLRLDDSERRFCQAFSRLPRRQARGRGGRRTESAPHPRRGESLWRPRAVAAHAGIRPPRSRQNRHARERRRNRCGGEILRTARARRAQARARAHRGLSPPAKADRRAFTDALGVEMGAQLDRDRGGGLYVPGGTAAYPSSVLMNAVPAKVAGCARLVMVVPAPDGKLSPLGAGGGQACRRRRDLSHRRRAGGGGARLRHRDHRARSPRSSAPAMPMWRRPSGWCSARSAST